MKPMVILIAVANLAFLNPAGSSAQERTAEMSREDWQAQVQASRARAEVMKREHRSAVVQQPTVEQIAERNSRRILEDESLLPRDIISTNRGLFRFRGSPDRDRRPDDFERVR